MYLSKVTLKQGPKLFKLLKFKSGADGYIAHQLLWDLFPNDGFKKRDFLFHKDEKIGLPNYYLVSRDKPIETDVLSVQTKPFSPQLLEGQKLAFTLIANPVVSRKKEGKKLSVKHDVWMDAKKAKREELKNSSGIFEKTPGNLQKVQQACEKASKEWLIRQGHRCGFTSSSENILINGYLQNRFYKGKGKSPIEFSSIYYEGILTVTDSTAFTKMLGEGLGKSKAFGCGLMLVRKI